MADHFELFALPRAFDVDDSALQSRYLELARQTHPDFAGADLQQQMAAMRRSAEVNEAYRILSDPERRANYLLELLGGPRAADDHSLPDGFLDGVIELRTELAEAHERNDPQALAAIRRLIESERQRHLKTISSLFARLLAGSPDTADASAGRSIRMELNALRYIQRALDQAS